MSHLFKKILCPVDLQDDSVAALDLAINIADRIDASLVLMYVVATPPQAAELALEALTPYPVWERASRLKLETDRQRASPEQSPLRDNYAQRHGRLRNRPCGT
jgi:nucleotide-binding universal stress UspA family protein